MAGSGEAHLRDADAAVLRVEKLVVNFPTRDLAAVVHAVSSVSFDVMPGETLGLVGESGCGKSTTVRTVVGLIGATSGSVRFEGTELAGLKRKQMVAHRARMQLIFQDPIGSLYPRHPVRTLVREPLDIWKVGTARERESRVARILEDVGLDVANFGSRRPAEMSGGQCQRVSIARALVHEPRLLICDEPVSALDVSVQAQILNLLEDMKARYGLTMVFVSHDLAVIKNISDRVAVMYLGKLCEIASSEDLYAEPTHPYTRLLLASVPVPDPALGRSRRRTPRGELPSNITPPSGCRFRTRCPAASELCVEQEPLIRELRAGHYVACHHPEGA